MQRISHRFSEDIDRMKMNTVTGFARLIAVLILPVLVSAGCSSPGPVTESVRFALTGNTSPDSPFAGFTRSLPELLTEIENRKPQIIIHTGDAFYGGNGSDGILESDMRRQMDIFFSMLKNLTTAIYTIPGEKDYYDGSASLYSSYTGKKAAYSFNYGSIHFVCLSSSDTAESFIDSAQLEWLKNDLKEFRDSNATFIMAHHQLFPEKKKGKFQQANEDIHKLFLKYNVKAVFSGAEKEYTTRTRDNIKYINAGCSGITEKKDNKKGYRFYIVNFFSNDITVDPVK